jgi:molybdate transport system substrate-binding protein
MKVGRWTSWLAAVVIVFSGAATAAEVRVMISAGFFGVYSQLAPAFEKATGHKLVTTRGPSMGIRPKRFPRAFPAGSRRTS